MDKCVGWAVVCWGWNLVFCCQCMVERTREQLKCTYLHLFVNRQSINSLADVVLSTQIRNHAGTTSCNFDIFGLCLWNWFLVQSNGWSYSFFTKFAIINEAPLFCYVSFKIRQSCFDIKEFLKNLLHFMDLCSQVLLITTLTIRTYLQLITMRSKDYLQFISIKLSFQLIMTIKITMIMIISIIISCYSNGYVADLPGVFSVWYSLDTF